MLDLARLQRVRLARVPRGHVNVARYYLSWNYRFPRRTEIVLEGLENLPLDGNVMLAMNHTDTYNYWPLQYAMHCRGGIPYTATWVKGKYYHNRWVAYFLDSTNNIPVPSRGYVLSTQFMQALRRKPDEDEYRRLRQAIDGGDLNALESGSQDLRRLVEDRGGPQGFRQVFEDLWDSLVRQVERLNRQALRELGLNVLVFPQGTRSRRLSQGHTGLAQMALHLRAAVVPVACNGSDRVYPDQFPVARGGRIVYRFGAPLEPDGPEIAPYRIRDDFLPLSRVASELYAGRFRAVTDLVMDRINAMLDPEYRYSEDRRSQGVQGVDRFL